MVAFSKVHIIDESSQDLKPDPRANSVDEGFGQGRQVLENHKPHDTRLSVWAGDFHPGNCDIPCVIHINPGNGSSQNSH